MITYTNMLLCALKHFDQCYTPSKCLLLSFPSFFSLPELFFPQFFYQMKGTENTYKQRRAITEQVQHLKRMAIFFFTLK